MTRLKKAIDIALTANVLLLFQVCMQSLNSSKKFVPPKKGKRRPSTSSIFQSNGACSNAVFRNISDVHHGTDFISLWLLQCTAQLNSMQMTPAEVWLKKTRAPRHETYKFYLVINLQTQRNTIICTLQQFLIQQIVGTSNTTDVISAYTLATTFDTTDDSGYIQRNGCPGKSGAKIFTLFKYPHTNFTQ